MFMGLLPISYVFKKPVLSYTFTFFLTCSVFGTISLPLPICHFFSLSNPPVAADPILIYQQRMPLSFRHHPNYLIRTNWCHFLTGFSILDQQRFVTQFSMPPDLLFFGDSCHLSYRDESLHQERCVSPFTDTM